MTFDLNAWCSTADLLLYVHETTTGLKCEYLHNSNQLEGTRK